MKSFKQFLNKRVLTVSALAKKHGVDTDYIEKQLQKGIKVEHEHSTKLKVARQIALAHLGEDPDYYKKLKKIEKKQLKEERRAAHNTLSSFFNKNDSIDEGKLKRAFTLRKTMNDTEIGEHYGKIHGGGRPYDGQTVKSFFDRFKDHPHYVDPLFAGRKHNEEDFKKTVFGLQKIGHSASSIADMLHSEERPVNKNRVIGILNRIKDDERKKFTSDLEKGIEPEEYTKFKNKPVTSKLQGRAGWKTNKQGVQEMKQEISEGIISNLINVIKKKKSKPTGEERQLHAAYAYKHINKAHEEIRKLLADKNLHPNVRQYLQYLEGHTTITQNALNKMSVGKSPTTTKKEKSGRM
jgi:hypothetical protein